jgi:hypothetical protein
MPQIAHAFSRVVISRLVNLEDDQTYAIEVPCRTSPSLSMENESRHVHGNGETGFYRPTDLLVKPYTNLAVTVPNHPFFKKTGIFK